MKKWNKNSLINNIWVCKFRGRYGFSTNKISEKITQQMVRRFSVISGDKNPLHINKEYAQKSIFK